MVVLLTLCSFFSVAAASLTQSQAPLHSLDHSQGYEFDPLLHLPGISPYFDALGFGLQHRAPEGCNVTAASYLIRHAAIYCNDKEYFGYIRPLLWRLEQHRGLFTGPLSFLNTWHSPIPEDELEHVTPSGARDAVKVGKHLLARYPELVPSTKKILADKKSRTYDTAKSFVQAFDHAESIEVVRVLDNVNGSMDALIPHKTCQAFSKDPGANEMATFVSHYGSRASMRLAPYSPFTLSPNDILALQALCGYESAIDGVRSKICGVFTDAEWMAYEYAWDLRYAYMVGPLNRLSPYLGMPWLRAQSEVFSYIHDNEQQHKDSTEATSIDVGPGWPSDQRLFLAFTHREVPPFIATALGLFNSSSDAVEEFPPDRINWTRAWRMSDLIPFLGHVGMELLTCEAHPDAHSREEGRHRYVRVIANTAPRPIPSCQDGPGASCAFADFLTLVKDGMQKYGDFQGVCGEKPEPGR